MFLNPLFKHWYQADVEAHPPGLRSISVCKYKLGNFTDIMKRGTFVGNNVKRVPVFDILSTLFRVCFSILYSSIGTKLTWKRIPRGFGQ